jgi:hypothetical protein
MVAVCRGSIACPVAAVKEWLAAAGIVDGPAFPAGRQGRRAVCGSTVTAEGVFRAPAAPNASATKVVVS